MAETIMRLTVFDIHFIDFYILATCLVYVVEHLQLLDCLYRQYTFILWGSSYLQIRKVNLNIDLITFYYIFTDHS